MEITEVRTFLKEGNDKKLKAYATVTFDNAFVVRNIKVIEGQKGLFVAMPSRKLKDPCPKCNFKNALRSKFCNNCGTSLPMQERKPVHTTTEVGQKESEHRDIAHPITLECREYLQKKVLEAYEAERKQGKTVTSQATPAQPAAEAQPAQPAAEARPAQPETEKKKGLEGDLEF